MVWVRPKGTAVKDHTAGDDPPSRGVSAGRKDTAEVLWDSDVLNNRRDCVSF